MTYVDEMVLKYTLDTSQYDREMARINGGKRSGVSGTPPANELNSILAKLGTVVNKGKLAGGGTALAGGITSLAGNIGNAKSLGKNTTSQDKNTTAIDKLTRINESLVKGFIYLNAALNRLTRAMVAPHLYPGDAGKQIQAKAFWGSKESDYNASYSWVKRYGQANLPRGLRGVLGEGDMNQALKEYGSDGAVPPVIVPQASKFMAFFSKFSKVLVPAGIALGAVVIAIGAVVSAFSVLNSALTFTMGMLGRIAQGFQTAFQALWGLVEKGSAKIAQERGILFKNGPEGVNRLRQLANTTPGIDFATAAKASLQLQGAGADAAFAERAILGLSNALLLAGGTSEDLQGVVQALAQIASKGAVNAEELNQQLAERLPGLRKLLIETFGTASAEELNKSVGVKGFITGLVQAMYAGRQNVPQELPEVIGRGKNLIEEALSNLGIGVGRAFTPIIESLSTALGNLKPEFLQNIGQRIGKAFTKVVEMFGGVPKIIATIIVTLQELPNFLNQFIPIVVNLGKNLITASGWIVKAMVTLGEVVLHSMGLVGQIILHKNRDLINGLKEGIKVVEGSFKVLSGSQFNAKVEKLTKELSKGLEPLSDPGEGTFNFAMPNSAEKETAANTRAMVELQQKAVDLNKQLLGGGQLASHATSPFALTKSGAYAGGWEAQLAQAVKAAVIQMGLSTRVARA